ncbi:calcium/sodium antiporter [Clostridium fallax]|uniref:Cation:H+ antiporter n=1 Tax=Clostridium fallax TaxID=1533 RepID=A0A1M4SI24_9CLOT|nr:calcium/sodium antiporter [Clostridium fallax]SHE31836.1 cation:H+ antiporter [Clostridium fallax]SQB07840.1 K+-dependent Na+/Ca+ exchanger-like protein [Clostridium fallax]
MNYIILILGFILLIKGADIFVDGASSIAKKIGIPSVIVGLTIVSIGTSSPELAVSVISSVQGNNGIALGNVLGSNIFNSLVVLGGTALVMPIIIKKATVKRDFFVNLLVTLVLFFLTFDSLFFSKENVISRLDGLILVILCFIYMFLLIKSAKNSNIDENLTEKEKNISIPLKILMSILGILGIVIGGKLVVDSATNIAYSLGMSEKLVGLTIVAAGTSLPELVTSIVAALKGETDIAIGNVLGSNIFNILLILGLSSLISPIPVSKTLIFDFVFLIVVCIFIGALVFFNKNKKVKKLSKVEGLVLVGLYIGYMVYIIIRN